jgi:hypothetical protein
LVVIAGLPEQVAVGLAIGVLLMLLAAHGVVIVLVHLSTDVQARSGGF